MTTLLEQKMSDGRKIADVVFSPIDDSGRTLNFVDVGARNGSYLLPEPYANRCKLVGFEPNSEEFDKLLSGKTDAKAAGIFEPRFKEKEYFPSALWDSGGKKKLNITVGAGASTLMGAVEKNIVQNIWRERDRTRGYYQSVHRTVKVEQISCATLDDVWSGNSELIDILKLDVEGAELNVLKGAKKLLKDERVLIVYSEFLFVPLYKRRVLLGHQQVFLDELGYRLIALNLDHAPYSWGPTTIRCENDRWMTYAGDAIFVLDPDRNALDTDSIYRLGLACMGLGFNAFGLNLIKKSGLVSIKEIEAIETQSNKQSLFRRLHKGWNKAPAIIDRAFNVLKIR
jgi:FkbM family methyltransferase